MVAVFYDSVSSGKKTRRTPSGRIEINTLGPHNHQFIDETELVVHGIQRSRLFPLALHNEWMIPVGNQLLHLAQFGNDSRSGT